jgi:3-deoxy-D-manno-octulosonate 8-phosphate phosphatase (KDO 8-P phosphatase)
MQCISDRELKERIARIRLLILDVDGVLTDGRIIYDSEGRSLRSFDAQDGTGVRILSDAGIKTMLATLLPSKAVEQRAKDMKVAECFQGVVPKTRILKTIFEKYAVSEEEICYVGDDLVDLGMMKAVGFPAAVANACAEIKKVACYITEKQGGRGAVREIAELILRMQGRWEEVVGNSSDR